mgnify:CR=1 FL=1
MVDLENSVDQVFIVTLEVYWADDVLVLLLVSKVELCECFFDGLAELRLGPLADHVKSLVKDKHIKGQPFNFK